MNSTARTRGPAAVAVRPPATLRETLAAAGIAPRARSRRRHGLIWHWFADENIPVAIGTALVSIALLVFAMTMTVIGMQIAVALDMAATIYVVLNDGLPYLGLALLLSGLAKALHTRFVFRDDTLGRVLGYGSAALLIAGGIWLEIMLGYAGFIPWMFKPILALAGGTLTTHIAAFDNALVSYFEPATAGVLGFVLAAKQIKSSVEAGRHRARGVMAIAGLVASTAALAIGLYAANRHFAADDQADTGMYVIGGDNLSDGSHVYGSAFAPGVQCRISDLFGWRTDPLDPARQENHQGVDLAVKAGTPVHAMANGRILFAEFDNGLGNLVALKIDGAHQPTLLAGHMQSLAVKAGDIVRRGDVIGYAGSTGRSTGPHVHLQVCPDAQARDGHLVCGRAQNPYEVWPALAAIARMSCDRGPRIF